MASLTATLQLSYGEAVPAGVNIPARQTLTFTLPYVQESAKTILVPAASTNFPIDLDTLTAPKFVFAQSLDVDVTITLSDGVVATPTPSALQGGAGWFMVANGATAGQAINRIFVNTPASPTTGAHIQVLAFA